MLKGEEGRPQGLEDQGVKNRKRPAGEGAVRGQKQWGLWHCGAGRKIRPVRKPQNGESKGWEVLCVQGCSVLGVLAGWRRPFQMKMTLGDGSVVEEGEWGCWRWVRIAWRLGAGQGSLVSEGFPGVHKGE